MNSLTISVLTSVYESEEPSFLDRCIRSVWTDQTLKPNQIILIQDGPVCNELSAIINYWKQELGDIFIVHKNDENLGLTKSLNIGLQYVTCDLIARIDTDDVCMPNRLEIQERFLRNNPNIFVVGGAVYVMDENETFKYVKHRVEKHEDIVKQMFWKCPLPHPGVMMRAKPFIDGVLRYDERYRNSQDIALWFDALRNGYRFANLPDIVIKFTQANDTYKRRGRVRAQNEYEIFARGTKDIFGRFSPKRIVPCLRYLFRRIPVNIIKGMYNSRIMKKLFAR